jgi:hypothetical protein
MRRRCQQNAAKNTAARAELRRYPPLDSGTEVAIWVPFYFLAQKQAVFEYCFPTFVPKTSITLRLRVGIGHRSLNIHPISVAFTWFDIFSALTSYQDEQVINDTSSFLHSTPSSLIHTAIVLSLFQNSHTLHLNHGNLLSINFYPSHNFVLNLEVHRH